AFLQPFGITRLYTDARGTYRRHSDPDQRSHAHTPQGVPRPNDWCGRPSVFPHPSRGILWCLASASIALPRGELSASALNASGTPPFAFSLSHVLSSLALVSRMGHHKSTLCTGGTGGSWTQTSRAWCLVAQKATPTLSALPLAMPDAAGMLG